MCNIQYIQDRKVLTSPDYNYVFNTRNGFFARWGKTSHDDPDFSPFGPELVDIEITTKCYGIVDAKDGKRRPCDFCYKGNNPNGVNMDYATFMEILQKLPKTVNQIAFGTDATGFANMYIRQMMLACCDNGIAPNITVADLSRECATQLADHGCKAIAVSRYNNKDVCYRSITNAWNAGIKQICIHSMVSDETFDQCIETINDVANSDLNQKVKAIVFLSLKQVGRGNNYHHLPQEKFKQLIDLAASKGIGFGFDSCSAFKFLNSIENQDQRKALEMLSEPCEALKFSCYFDVSGSMFPCSFAKNFGEWKEGLSIHDFDTFDKMWMHEKVKKYREQIIGCTKNCKACLFFRV